MKSRSIRFLDGTDGDVRLALRTVLIQNLELQVKLQSLEEKVGAAVQDSLN
jgi:hypothetical protein